MLYVQDGYLSGALLYLRPEHRGRGLCGAYFDAALELARREGLLGFRFLSTLPKWSKDRYSFERRFHVEQSDGTVVWNYRRAA